MHGGKDDPGVSELPRSNELSRDHVNRPLDFRARRINTSETSPPAIGHSNVIFIYF